MNTQVENPVLIERTYEAPNDSFLDRRMTLALVQCDVKKDPIWTKKEKDVFIRLLKEEKFKFRNYQIEEKADNTTNKAILKLIHYV